MRHAIYLFQQLEKLLHDISVLHKVSEFIKSLPISSIVLSRTILRNWSSVSFLKFSSCIVTWTFLYFSLQAIRICLFYLNAISRFIHVNSFFFDVLVIFIVLIVRRIRSRFYFQFTILNLVVSTLVIVFLMFARLNWNGNK